MPSDVPEQFVAASARVLNAVNVLLLTTGSVASIKAPLIAAALLEHENVQLQVVSTQPSLTFFDPADIVASGKGKGKDVHVWRDEHEWQSWKKIGDPILHIELRRWADVVLVAPCSANTLAKIAGGLCDNLATSLLRALNPTTPTYIFPAMNTHMYAHPLTAKHLDIVSREIGYKIVGPIGKGLACGDVGVGGMTDWRDIVKLVEDEYILPVVRKQANLDKGTQGLQAGVAKLELLSPPAHPVVLPSTPPNNTTALPVPLKSRWDTLISLSTPATTRSPTPDPPPSPTPPSGALAFDRDARHPLTLPLDIIYALIKDKILPPTLVHREHPSAPGAPEERRLFWFVPSRLEQRQLEGLARAAGDDAQGKAQAKGEWADEVTESREWLAKCYGED